MRVAKYLMERAGFTSQLFGSPLSYPPLSEQSDLGEISPARRCHRDGVQDSRCRGVVPYPVAVQHVGHRVSAPPPNGEPLPTVAVKEHPTPPALSSGLHHPGDRAVVSPHSPSFRSSSRRVGGARAGVGPSWSSARFGGLVPASREGPRGEKECARPTGKGTNRALG